MKLRLFTLPSCPRCPEAKRIVDEVSRARQDITIEILDMSSAENLTTALMLQIASTPSICLDDEVVAVGDVPSLGELNTLIEEHKGKLRPQP